MKIHKTVLADSKGEHHCYEFILYEESNQIIVTSKKIDESMQYIIDLDKYSCSCPSRKQPCKHLKEVPFLFLEKSDISPEALLNEEFYKEMK